ncbi:MAG TPA: poly-beta-1,6 N-acetyl-D-glucosamine export porin PgaA [Alphaproteobacteria bacterium]|nr:poly-beta-1,6 N-acetyl-D-glucosamine export porin PgaA [Alphaproteobacteria bacterium]
MKKRMPHFRHSKIFQRTILFAALCAGIALFSATGFAQWSNQSPTAPQPQDNSTSSGAPAASQPMQLAHPSAPVNADAASDEQAQPKSRHHRAGRSVASQKGAAPPGWMVEHNEAVTEARNGDTHAAVVRLQKLHDQHPQDVGITRDYLAVLGWEGGHDQQVIDLYKSLKDPDQPGFVLLAVGHAYRGIKDPDAARLIYERGLTRNPKDESMAAGLIYSLSDAGYQDAAMKTADSNVQQYGNRAEVLIAAGDAADQYGQNDRALSYYETAYNISPNNPEAIRGIIRAKDRAADPEGAMRIADAHPGVFPKSEYRHIQGDVVAYLIRKGQVDATGESDRFNTTDRAIKMGNDLIAQWSKEGPDAKNDIIRVRLDQLIALRNRFRMQEVITNYNDLVNQGVTVPPYVLSSVADAYLYLHEPEKARDLYLQVLQSDPKNFDVRRQLFYAYAECDDYKNAFATIDDLQHDRPYWANLAGQGNPDFVKRQEETAQLVAGSGRQYAGMVRASENYILPLVNANPNAPQSHEALGNLYMAHGWPRQGLQQYQAAVSSNGGKYVSAEVGEAEAMLQLQQFPEATAKINDLAQRVPENSGVQRAQRDLDVHNMSEVRVSAGYAFRPMGSSQPVTGGEAYGIDTIYYTPPIGYNWRAFIGEFYSHQNEPNHEGSVGYNRATVGAEYRNGPWVAEISPTWNRFNGGDRIGGAGDASYSINDYWTVAGAAEIMSRDTPLRALNAGISSDEYAAHAVWRQNEGRELRFGGDVQPFSDGNTRTALNASYAENIITVPDFTTDALVDLGESQNTKDENRPYYNPSRDFMALVGPRFIQTLYQHYSTLWTHSLRLEPGVYWQQNFGTSAAFRARYEQRLQLNNTFDMGAGVNYSRQSYDGVPENDVSLSLDLTGRF